MYKDKFVHLILRCFSFLSCWLPLLVISVQQWLSWLHQRSNGERHWCCWGLRILRGLTETASPGKKIKKVEVRDETCLANKHCIILLFSQKTPVFLHYTGSWLGSSVHINLTCRKCMWSSVCESFSRSECLFFSRVISSSKRSSSISPCVTVVLSWERIISLTSLYFLSMESRSSVKTRSFSSWTVWAECWWETEERDGESLEISYFWNQI